MRRGDLISLVSEYHPSPRFDFVRLSAGDWRPASERVRSVVSCQPPVSKLADGDVTDDLPLGGQPCLLFIPRIANIRQQFELQGHDGGRHISPDTEAKSETLYPIASPLTICP